MYVIEDLNGKKINIIFCEKELQNQSSLQLKKELRKKVINYILSGKIVVICLIDGQIKRDI